MLSGTGIPVATIQERFRGGDSAKALARDFGVGVAEIEEAQSARLEEPFVYFVDRCLGHGVQQHDRGRGEDRQPGDGAGT